MISRKLKSQTQETWAEHAGCLAERLQFFHTSKNNTSAAYCCSPPSIFDSLIDIRHEEEVILLERFYFVLVWKERDGENNCCSCLLYLHVLQIYTLKLL